MAETNNNNIDPTPSTPITSDSTKNSTAPATSSGKKPKKDDPDTIQVSKRRKNCPKALDEVQDFMHSNQSNLSFTFDTKFSEYAPEFTPRFGSFNILVSAQDKDKCSHQNLRDKQGTEDKEAGVSGEIEVVNALTAVDKIKEISEK